ncbi:MAG TPA: DNA recombination protein RmuC [Flavobacteriaceae bacterium]|nr:DNA recombination protein RmuC [Flavobacteriaceae bacterium]
METYLIFGFAIIVAVLLGFFFGKMLSKTQNSSSTNVLEERTNQLQSQLIQKQSEIDNLKLELETKRTEKEGLQNELTRRETEFENLRQKNEDQQAEVEKLQEKFTKEFENLANKILEQKSEKFTLQNKENIENILKPLGERIKTFEEKVDKNSSEFTRRHAELGIQLRFLNEQNLKISQEAVNLTKALKGDTKLQGNWGEMVLERVLERSGLRKDSEYFVQQSFTTDEGKRLMPDVIIHLPGNKKMIVDSKVSLIAYERYINEIEELEKISHLKNHLISIRNRVEELGKKDYHLLYQMESPDFVLLFIPIEAAFAIASHEYPRLYSDAFDKNIIIVTPTTLLAVLKTIDSMWQNEKQKQNAIDIATQAGSLYDSFCSLTEELLKIGRQIGTVQTSYEGAMKKLTGKGNLIKKVEKLKNLGAKASKQLNQKLVARAEENDEND